MKYFPDVSRWVFNISHADYSGCTRYYWEFTFCSRTFFRSRYFSVFWCSFFLTVSWNCHIYHCCFLLLINHHNAQNVPCLCAATDQIQCDVLQDFLMSVTFSIHWLYILSGLSAFRDAFSSFSPSFVFFPRYSSFTLTWGHLDVLNYVSYFILDSGA